mgnify:CR=1 FL=1
MSTVTVPVLTDATFAEKMDIQNALIGMLVDGQITQSESLAQIRAVVAQGLAPTVFSIGDRITVPWSDGNGNEYAVPLDVVHFGNVELEDGETVPGMYLQWHYATPFGMPFDANEALYYCETALPAGVYQITQGNAWGSKALSANGRVWTFRTTIEIPAGGHICITTGAVDNAESAIRFMTYASGASTTPLETITPSYGTTGSGTSLGTWSSSTKFGTSGLNNMQRSNYGYNRWSQSCLRQWLNSAAAKGAWWTSQNVYDRIPTECASYQGFMAGFSEEFRRIIGKVKVRTALNTVSDSDIIAASGALEETFDYWFPAALEQEHVKAQIAGEGEVWEYWKRTRGSAEPEATHPYVNPMAIRYAINAKTSPQYCRLRSAGRGDAYGAWGVYAAGTVGSYYATAANRCAPACVIC